MEEKDINIDMPDTDVLYQMKIRSSCPYEVRFGDVIVDFNYDRGAVDYTLDLNPWILKSGRFEIQARLLNNYEAIKPSSKEYFEISIATEGSEEPLYVLKYGENDDLSKIWNVDLEVPYEVIGWEGSANLSNEDNSRLLTEVLEVYNSLKKDLNGRQISSYLAKTKHRLSEKASYFYFSQDDVNESLEESTKEYNRVKIMPIEQFFMSIEANGKMVRLIRSDKANKGESAFRADDGDSIILYDVFLHRPNEGGALEIIR